MSNQTEEQPSIQELRDAADRGREATKRAAELERDNAMLRAGVPTDTPLGQMFARAYDGQLEPDAVKAAWAEVAPSTESTPPPPEETEQVNESERQAETDTRRTLTTGGAGESVGTPPPTDPVKKGYDDFQEALRDGQSRERASAAVFGNILTAAASGDERVIFSGWKPEDLQP